MILQDKRPGVVMFRSDRRTNGWTPKQVYLKIKIMFMESILTCFKTTSQLLQVVISQCNYSDIVWALSYISLNFSNPHFEPIILLLQVYH